MTNKRLKGYRHANCEERKAIENYINNIDDSFIKKLFKLRYVRGYSWQAVAYRSKYSGGADGCRKAVMRYLQKN